MTDPRPIVPTPPLRPLAHGALIATLAVLIGGGLMLAGCQSAGEAWILGGLDSPAGTLVEPGTEATPALSEPARPYSAFDDPRLGDPPISRYALVDLDRVQDAMAAGAAVRRSGGEYHVEYPMRDVPWTGSLASLHARYGPWSPGFRRLCPHIPHVGTGPGLSADDVLEWGGYTVTPQGQADLEATCSSLYQEYLIENPGEGGNGGAVEPECDLFGMRPGPAPEAVVSEGRLVRVRDLDRAGLCCWAPATSDPFTRPRPAQYTAACTSQTPPPPPPPGPVCGDGTCDSGETATTCPADCQGPPPPPPASPPAEVDLSPITESLDRLESRVAEIASRLQALQATVLSECGQDCAPCPPAPDCNPVLDCASCGSTPPPSPPPVDPPSPPPPSGDSLDGVHRYPGYERWELAPGQYRATLTAERGPDAPHWQANAQIVVLVVRADHRWELQYRVAKDHWVWITDHQEREIPQDKPTEGVSGVLLNAPSGLIVEVGIPPETERKIGPKWAHWGPGEGWRTSLNITPASTSRGLTAEPELPEKWQPVEGRGATAGWGRE